MIDIKHLTPATAEKGDSQGKIISFGKIHDYFKSAIFIMLIIYLLYILKISSRYLQ